jgi:hypothetical protein
MVAEVFDMTEAMQKISDVKGLRQRLGTDSRRCV